MPVNYPSSSILHSHAACRNRASNPIRRRPPRSAEGDAPADQHAADGPASDSAGGTGATDARELLIVAILQCSAVSRGGRDLQADSVRLADRCFGACGTAARRLRGRHSAIPPFALVFRGVRRKRSAVDGETWLNALSPSSNFEYLVIPHHHSGQLN